MVAMLCYSVVSNSNPVQAESPGEVGWLGYSVGMFPSGYMQKVSKVSVWQAVRAVAFQISGSLDSSLAWLPPIGRGSMTQRTPASPCCRLHCASMYAA